MTWFLAGWVVVLQVLFWGLGLTLLILPRRWQRFWPGFVAPVGLGLQSAVVWAGAHTTMPGTDYYALAALSVPAALLAGAAWKLGLWRSGQTLAAVRHWWILLPILCLSLGLQIAPFTKPPGLLTSQAMGSCDAADYAAGARVLKEFSSRDRTGFMGEKEAVQVLQVDNFFEFWLRLNHFSPSALLALDATLLRRQPYELTSLLGVALQLLVLPTVFWLARSLFRFGPQAAGMITAIYAVNPIPLYAVYQVALGQLLAAPAVGLILWSCFLADRANVAGQSTRRRWSCAGLLLAGNSLLLGSYNFFVLFAFVPVAAYVGGRALLRRGPWRAVWQMAGFIGANLLVCTLLLPERVISLGERLLLFHETKFGWSIPVFRPDGWYGVFASAKLTPSAGVFLPLGLIGLAAVAGTDWYLVRRSKARTAGLAAACLLPILCGYGILSWEETSGLRANASYDAYKLFTVFYPELLLGLCLFLRTDLFRGSGWRVTAWMAAGLILALGGTGSWRYNAVVRHSYQVEPALDDLATVERMPQVDGINLRVQNLWDRLWANQFLLRKTQYFPQATYEGRRMTPLSGRWDLCDRYLAPEVPARDDLLKSNAEFALLDRQGTAFLDVRLAEGWNTSERDRGSHWCWSKGSPATVTVFNPHGALDARLHLGGGAVRNRPLRLFVGENLVYTGQVSIYPAHLTDATIHLPPGLTTLRFETPGEPDHTPGDWRTFGFALYTLQIEPLSAQPAEAVPPSPF